MLAHQKVFTLLAALITICIGFKTSSESLADDNRWIATRVRLPDDGIYFISAGPYYRVCPLSSRQTLALVPECFQNRWCTFRQNDDEYFYDVLHNSKPVQMTVAKTGDKPGSIQIVTHESYDSDDLVKLANERPELEKALKQFQEATAALGKIHLQIDVPKTLQFESAKVLEEKAPELMPVYAHHLKKKKVEENALKMTFTPRIIIPDEEEEPLGVIARP
jgi:hypothetical protein